ncbi:ribosomal protein L7/L12 [Streptomyces sp. NPDC007904]|jgi:ribosomal protein L7/L12|uniref:ribosomal protein L7/L12 n=1 Tax=Streptomyces sp. NPDC007904 TaxID=3364787 RepID=UPI0036E57BC0
MDIALLFLTVVVLLGILTVQSGLSRTDRRIARVERRLDQVLAHLGIDEDLPRRDEIERLVREGRKVQAVKVYREATGAGLVEAKEAVDRLG